MSYQIGVNVSALTQGDTTWDSPDILSVGTGPGLYTKVQATLAVPYVGGSGVMQLNPPNPFTTGMHGQVNAATGWLNTAAGNVTLNFNAVGGTNNLYITSWNSPAQDVNYPAGTFINNANGGWTNGSHAPADWPLNPQFLDAGRPAGYPTGLNNGQKFYINITGYHTIQPGAYTIMARGTGTVQINGYNSLTGQFGANVNINVVAGVPSGPYTVAPGWRIYQVWIVASSAADPLHNVRLIMPDRAGHADDFVGQYRAQEGNPYFFLPHPDLVNSLKPFGIMRFMQMMGTISNAAVYTWANRPVWNGIGPGYAGIMPYEYLTALQNAVGCDGWYCIPTNVQPDYITSFAEFLLAQVNAPLRIAAEWANEVWNSSYSQNFTSAFMGVALYNPSVVQQVTYSAATGTATVTMNGHGFPAGATIQICNAVDDGFNGAYPITVPDANTFRYVPPVAPTTTPAAAIPFHAIMALNTASTYMRPIAAASWDGKGTITIDTATPHGGVSADVWQVCNSADPAFNGLWPVTVVNPTRLSLTYNYGHMFNRPMCAGGNPPPGTIPLAAGAGRSLAVYRVGNANGTGTIPGLSQVFLNQSLYMGNLLAQIHSTFRAIFAAAGQEGRLIGCLMWQMPFGPATWNFTQTIDHYLAALGGSFLPGMETAIGAAPYWPVTDLKATILGNAQAVAAGNLTAVGGIATVHLKGHGHATGDRIQVANAAQVPYNGVVTITVIDADNFRYPVVGAPASPATIANSGNSYPGTSPMTVFCCKDPPYQRELTAVAVSGTTMTCTSPGHGWASGLVVNLCAGTSGHLSYEYTNTWPAIYGQFVITVVDPNTFTVQLDPKGGTYTLPPNNSRMWAWDSSAIEATIELLMPLPNISGNFAGVKWARDKYYPTATIRTYEGGPNYFWFDARQYPAMWDIEAVTMNSPRFADVYTEFMHQVCDINDATSMCQYVHIQPWGGGFWGIKEWQHEVNNPTWDAIMGFCAGTPDHTDDGVFPGFLPPSVVPPPLPLEGSSILLAGLGGPLLATRGYRSPAAQLAGPSILLRGLGGTLLATRGYRPAAPVVVVTAPLMPVDPDAGTSPAGIGPDPDAGSLILGVGPGVDPDAGSLVIMA